MKQKDLILIIVMVFVGAVAALVASRLFFSSPQNRSQKAEVVDAITAEFSQPPTKYFNGKSVNPTQQIEIGGTTNPNPFNTKSQ